MRKTTRGVEKMTIKVIRPEVLYNEYHPEHEEKPVVEPTTKTSEDVHGGDEITQSMKDQRFAQQTEGQQNDQQNETTQQQNQNASQLDDKQTEQRNTNDNSQQNESQSNNENQQNDQQTEQQQNDQSQNNNDSGQNQQTEQQQNNTQQTNENQQNDQPQTNQQQNELQNKNDQQNEINQQNNKTQSEQQQTNENQQSEHQNTTEDNNETNQQQTQQKIEQQQNEQSQSNNTQQTNDSNEQTEQQQQNNTQQNDEQEDETKEQTLDDSVSDDYQEQEDEEEDDYEEDDYYEDEQEQEDTTQYNTQQAFKINEKHSIKRQLYLAFYRLVEYLSDEEKQPTLLPGPTLVLNVKKLMMRQYERKPINAYYYYRTRSQVVLILDNSGSMAWLMDELNTFFESALKRKDVQIYIAPNGNIEEYYNDKTKLFELIDHDYAIRQIIRSGLPVIYVGDFDGANTPIELSWTNRVYWICTETRYKYFSHHDWVGRCLKVNIDGNCEDFRPYHEDDFKGFFGRAFNDKEIITVLKEFAKNIYRQRFWYDKHDIKDFSEE